MQTHDDNDFFRRLQERAEQIMEAERRSGISISQITAGKPGERVLNEWEDGDLCLTQRPEDEQGIQRISIGGGVSWAHVDYCVFRGNPTKCAFLLEQAAAAIRKAIAQKRLQL